MDSLSFLRPAFDRNYTLRPSEKTGTQLHIEGIMAHLVHLFNTRQYDDPYLQKHIADDFTAYVERSTRPIVISRQAFIELHRSAAVRNPAYSVELISIDSQMEKKLAVATLITVMLIRGDPVGMVREAVTVVKFQKINGTWMNIRQDGIRGVSGVGSSGLLDVAIPTDKGAPGSLLPTVDMNQTDCKSEQH